MTKEQQPTQEQIKEFWEWCGFKFIHEDYTPIHTAELQYPDGHLEEWNGWGDLLDLNNLFKYAVPALKLRYRHWRTILREWVETITGDTEKDTKQLFIGIWNGFMISGGDHAK